MGAERHKTQLDAGYALDGTVGHDFNPFRVEGELSWRNAEIDKHAINGRSTDVEGKVSSLGLMVNGWYDLHTASRWTPFIGGGIGGARIQTDYARTSKDDKTDWVFAYQAGAGLGYKLNESTTLQAQYRYFTTEEAGIEDGVHNMTVGLRYRF